MIHKIRLNNTISRQAFLRCLFFLLNSLFPKSVKTKFFKTEKRIESSCVEKSRNCDITHAGWERKTANSGRAAIKLTNRFCQ